MGSTLQKTMKKIKIIYFGPNLSSVVGGSKNVMCNILNNLNRKDFEVATVFIKGDSAEIKKLNKDVALFDLRWISSLKIGIAIKSKLQYLFLLYSVLRFNPSIFVIDGRRFGFGFAPKLKYIFPRKKIVFRMGGIFPDSQLNDVHYVESLQRIYSKADAILCASNNTREQYLLHFKLPESLITVIYNGINLQDISDKSLMPVDVDIPPSSKVCCYVGALNSRKDPLTLVKGFEIAKKSIPELIMVVVGSGEMEDVLRNYCDTSDILRNSVIFVGYKTNPYPYIQRSDIFFSASTRDGFGLTLLEAVAFKKAIIYADGNLGISEILKKYDIGLCFPVSEYLVLGELLINYFTGKYKYVFSSYDLLLEELSNEKFLENHDSFFKKLSS